MAAMTRRDMIGAGRSLRERKSERAIAKALRHATAQATKERDVAIHVAQPAARTNVTYASSARARSVLEKTHAERHAKRNTRGKTRENETTTTTTQEQREDLLERTFFSQRTRAQQLDSTTRTTGEHACAKQHLQNEKQKRSN
jgi:hypothetical protein